jgi:hypothetical protein
LAVSNHSKMKTQSNNIMPEGTCSGDVVGGLLLWTGESLQALLFYWPIRLEGETLCKLIFPPTKKGIILRIYPFQK